MRLMINIILCLLVIQSTIPSSNDTSSVINTIGNQSDVNTQSMLILILSFVHTFVVVFSLLLIPRTLENKLSVSINHLQAGTQVNGGIQSISSAATVSGVNINDTQSLNGSQSSINNSSLSGT